MQNRQIALVAALVFMAYLYFVFYFVFLKRATTKLGHESYAKFKCGPVVSTPLDTASCPSCRCTYGRALLLALPDPTQPFGLKQRRTDTIEKNLPPVYFLWDM